MSKAKKNILFAALAALALTVCLVGVTGAYFIAQASRTNTLTVGEVTFDPKEDIQNPDVPVQPGNSFMKRPYVVNTGNLPLRLRARVIFSDSAAQDACTLNYNTENWRYDETEDFWYYAKTLQPGEDCRNDALFDTVTCSTALFESFTVSPNLTNELAGRTGHIGVTMELLQASGDSPTLWGRTWSAYRRTPDAVAAKTQTAHIRFTYDENGGLIEYPDGQLFLDFQNLCPGETRSQLVAIDYTARNDSDAACSLWLRAALADNNKLGAETEEKIWKLLKQYAVITVTGPDNETLYSGPVWGNLDTDTNTMRNDLPLGRYSGTGTAHLNLTLTLDQNMPEELQGLLGYVDWTLTAAQESAPTVLVRYFPQTGIPER